MMAIQPKYLHVKPFVGWALLATPLVLLCSAVTLITQNAPTNDDIREECILVVDATQQLQLRAVAGTIGAEYRDTHIDCTSYFTQAGFSVVSFGPNFSRPLINGDYASISVGYPVRFLGGHGDDLIAHKIGRYWKLLSTKPAWLS